MNLLVLAVVCPVLGAVTVAALPRIFADLRFGVALAASALGALVTLVVAAKFAPVSSMQFAFNHELAPNLGVTFSLGVDGISLGFLVVSAVLCFVSMAVRGRAVQRATESHVQENLSALLLSQAALAGVYCADDAVVLWSFWALFAFGCFILVGSSGGSRRLLASSKLALSGFATLILLLGVFLYLASQVHDLTGRFSFDLAGISRVLLPLSSQYVVMLITLFALALALPLVPLTGWWNDTHAESSAVGSTVLMLGPALYVFVRVLLPCFPLAAMNVMPVVAAAAAIGAFCAAVCCAFEPDLRKQIAWTAVAQTAIAVAAFASLTAQGLMGALLVMASSALALSGLFLCVRTHPVEPALQALAGVERATVLPKLFACSAALLPGLGGFAAAFAALAGLAAADRNHARNGFPEPAFDMEPLWIILCLVGSSVAVGVVLLNSLRGTAGFARTERLGLRAWPLWLVLVALVALGLKPQTWVTHTEASINQYMLQLQGKIRHSSSYPEAPTHLFPNARSMLFSATARPPLQQGQRQ